jgi:hypothetical protein
MKHRSKETPNEPAGANNGGRYLRLIVEDFGRNIARIITGWDL